MRYYRVMQDRSLQRQWRLGEVPSPFPPFVAFAAQNAARCAYLLSQAEAALLHPQAVPKRKQEFLLGRAAAHQALQMLLQKEPGPLLSGERGEPLWPDGVVGAISHSGDLAVAAVAQRCDCAGLGLDLEGPSRADMRKMAHKICLPDELSWIFAQRQPHELLLKLFFSAKESAYKALFALGCEHLGFHDLQLSPGKDTAILHGRLLRDVHSSYPKGSELTIGYRFDGEYIFTWLALPPLY